MQLVVAATGRKSVVGGGVLPHGVASSGAHSLHALVEGSPVALCGTPVQAHPGAEAWPPARGSRCSTCETLLANYVG